jgi:hypothetical protein
MDGLMTFDLFIGISSKQDELAVCRSKTPQGSFGPMGEIKENEEMNEWNNESFAPCE